MVHLVAVAALALRLQSAPTGNVSGPVPSLPPLHAFVRADNDFAPDDDIHGRKVLVPSVVAARIHALARAEYNAECLHPPGCGLMRLADFYGPVFRVSTPTGLLLYVFHEPYPVGGWYHFILFNPTNGRAITQRMAISGRWMGNPNARHPLLAFTHLEIDSSPTIVIEEPYHSGTDDTGWIYHYYSVDGNGIFHRAIAVEWNWADRIVESVVTDSARDEEASITRRLTALGRNRLRLDCQLERAGGHSIALGSVVLARPHPGAPFRFVERRPREPRFNDILISFHGLTAEADLLDVGDKPRD